MCVPVFNLLILNAYNHHFGITFLILYFFVCFAATPSALKGYYFQCTLGYTTYRFCLQKIELGLGGCVQDNRPTHCAIALAPHFIILKETISILHLDFKFLDICYLLCA